MSRATKLFLMAIAVTLIFITGCKDKSKQDPAPKKETQEKSQPQETIIPAPKPIPETPAAKAVVEEKTPVDPVPVVTTVIDKENHDDAHAGWTSDYEAAVKKATLENKNLLLEFTGSNWCPPCMKLYKNVFSRKEFIEAASKDFVLVMLDYPRDKPLAPKLDAQNKQLNQKYGIQYFPTILLTDAKGRPYGKAGFMDGGPKEYLAHLSVLGESKIKFDELMKKAQAPLIDDTQKAKFIDEAIRQLSPEFIVTYYRDEIEKIIALDRDNKAGLRDRQRLNLALWEASKQLSQGNPDKAIEMVDKAIKDFKVEGEMAQEAYYFKAVIYDKKRDNASARASLVKALEVAPETEKAAEIKGIIEKYYPEEKTEEKTE